VSLSAVNTAVDPNLGDELYHICELRKGRCDVLTLVQVDGVNDGYLKVMFELFAQTRDLIRQIEVAMGFSWNSSTLLRRWRRLGLIAPFCMAGRRRQEASLIVKAAAEDCLCEVCVNAPQGRLTESLGAMERRRLANPRRIP
jgi:hypothetical protein